MSEQTPLHIVEVDGQPHTPAVHVSPGGQALPQRPHEDASFWRSTQPTPAQ
jgi:hypothetical protein